jgi:HAD superfamily hydrolase (TIGR01484 family)
MRPLAEFPIAARREVAGVLFDIDDTLTTAGRLTAEAYSALERLHHSGLLAVPITGRPAGWCDHIARMWPVDGVVGENGALYFRYDHASRRMTRRYVDSYDTRLHNKERLTDIGREIVDVIRGSALAADQPYRETDLAIDFCEDVPRLPDSAVDEIVKIMCERGLTAKLSSIHVNGWFGSYDKLTMNKLFVKECHGIDLDAKRASFVFVGDSPNDAPMFGYFPFAIGVANVRDFESRISRPPAYVTTERCGKGFREAAECILQGRQGNAPEW